MTALLAGVDWSTRAIHAAIIPLDPDHGDPDTPPVAFRMAELSGKDTVTRCQAVPYVFSQLLGPYSEDVASVWIEEAYGNHRNADRALLPIQGAIIANCRHRQVATMTAVEWRKQHGFSQRFSKADAVREAYDWMRYHRPDGGWTAPNEHEAEALLLALAAREITWRAAA